MKRLGSLLLFILFISSIALGNMGPSIDDPDTHGVFFDDSSKIQLVEETVTYDIDNRNINNGQVHVKYTLKNLEDIEKNFDVIFIAAPLEDIEVELKQNGKRVPPKEIKDNIKELPENWSPIFKGDIIEPISKNKLENIYSDYIEDGNITSIRFPISFKEKEEITIEISYIGVGGFYSRDMINTIFSHQYFLTPAKFWDGSSRVNLIINLPKERDMELYSNIPLKREGDSYTTTLEKIPENEWLFSYVDKDGLLFNTNYRKIHNRYLLGITLIIVVIGIILHKSINKYVGIIIYLLGGLFLGKFINLSYGTAFFAMLIGMFIIPIVGILLLIYALYKYYDRKNKEG